MTRTREQAETLPADVRQLHDAGVPARAVRVQADREGDDVMTTAPVTESMLLVMAETIAAACTDVTRWSGEPAAHFIMDMFFIAADPNPDFVDVTS